MARREVCFLIGGDGSVLWADAGSTSALPDSRSRWQEIWGRRAELAEIAHSHPHGPAAFSSEDDTTMAAVDSALGRPLRYSVVAPTAMIVRASGGGQEIEEEPWWAALLRLASGMNEEE